MDRITANLPARDFDETASFWARLGFEVDFRDATWMMLSAGPLELEFFPLPDLDPATSAHSACLRVDDLDALFARVAALGLPTTGIPRLHGPPRTIADDLRLFAIVDPNGSLLRCLRV